MDACVYICVRVCVLALFPMTYMQWDQKFLKDLPCELLLVVVTNNWDGEAM